MRRTEEPRTIQVGMHLESTKHELPEQRRGTFEFPLVGGSKFNGEILQGRRHGYGSQVCIHENHATLANETRVNLFFSARCCRKVVPENMGANSEMEKWTASARGHTAMVRGTSPPLSIFLLSSPFPRCPYSWLRFASSFFFDSHQEVWQSFSVAGPTACLAVQVLRRVETRTEARAWDIGNRERG